MSEKNPPLLGDLDHIQQSVRNVAGELQALRNKAEAVFEVGDLVHYTGGKSQPDFIITEISGTFGRSTVYYHPTADLNTGYSAALLTLVKKWWQIKIETLEAEAARREPQVIFWRDQFSTLQKQHQTQRDTIAEFQEATGCAVGADFAKTRDRLTDKEAALDRWQEDLATREIKVRLG